MDYELTAKVFKALGDPKEFKLWICSLVVSVVHVIY